MSKFTDFFQEMNHKQKVSFMAGIIISMAGSESIDEEDLIEHLHSKSPKKFIENFEGSVMDELTKVGLKEVTEQVIIDAATLLQKKF
jgi:hypothetical protein